MSVQQKILAGQRKVQGLWAEPLQLGSTNVTALFGQEMITQRFSDNNVKEVIELAASVVLMDLGQAPVIGSGAQARGKTWKVFAVRPTQTTWELTLESPTK